MSLENLKDLASIHAFSGIPSATVDLRSFVMQYNIDLMSQIGVMVKGASLEDMEPQVLVVVGPPGVGKTRTLKIINNFVNGTVNRFTGAAEDIRRRSLNWEEDGEGVARTKGLILTPPDEPYEANELQSANDVLEERMIEALETAEAITLELPAAAAVRVKGKWIGRKIGSDLLYDLTRRSGNFKRVSRPYKTKAVGMVGGPLLRYLLVNYRDFNRRAQSLEEAQLNAFTFGQPLPRTEEEWRESITGASEEQVRTIEWTMDSLAMRLQDRKLEQIKPRNSNQPLATLLQAETVAYSTNLRTAIRMGLNFRAFAQGKVLRRLFYENLKMDASQTFIGFNNPSLEDLGIPDINKLLSYIEMKGQGRFKKIEGYSLDLGNLGINP